MLIVYINIVYICICWHLNNSYSKIKKLMLIVCCYYKLWLLLIMAAL